MGFVVMGSSCFLHRPPCHHSLFSAQSSPSCASSFLFSSRKNAHAQKRNRAVMACLNQENPKDGLVCSKRLVLFMGFSLLPLLNLRAKALEGVAAETPGLRTEEKETKAEERPSGNPFLTLLNGLGIFSSGLLGALYASAQKDKSAAEATIESMKTELNEKDGAITSLTKKFETELLNEKEVRNKELAKANEEKKSLNNQLNQANGTMMSLGQELKKERRLIEELKLQVECLQGDLAKAMDEKTRLEEQLKEKLDSIAVLQERINLLTLEIKDKEDNLHNLNAKLAEKEVELNELNSVYHQSQDQLKNLSSEIKGLKNVLIKNEKELEVKNGLVDNLNVQISSLVAERDESLKKIEAIQKDYSHLKSSAEKKAASDAKLLSEREKELQELDGNLKFALDEVKRNNEFIAYLTQEKDNLSDMLNIELKNVKNLEHELRNTHETLEKSRDESSDLAKQLHESRNLCSELEAEISKVQEEFAEAKESLERIIHEAKQGAELLAAELSSAKALLKKTNEELKITAQELAAAVGKSEGLQKELADAHKKLETAAHELKEEKKITSSLDKEFKVLETQILKDKEVRKSLEADLEDATKSLDEMNRNTLLLSRDLEVASSRISSLEDEREALYKSLDEQKHISQEARENLEDAHNLVMRLGKERESLETRGKKLEEELASTKGEILRLRTQINSSDTPVHGQPQQQTNSPKKVNRRRKAAMRKEDS